jgi:7-keto-8-aminopelargonate synthetase-like enzyme
MYQNSASNAISQSAREKLGGLLWPVREGREQDLYFYLEAIEAYLPDNRVRVVGHGEMLMLGGYSYLGLNGHPRINGATYEAIERYGTGTEGARLLAGTLEIHRQLEARVAKFKGTEAAVTFSSGYFANVSAIACLIGHHDTVICDKLDHASIVDGARLSAAKFVRFRHNDMGHLEECLKAPANSGRKQVIVDAVSGMDGDIINLPDVSRLCRQYGASLMVDEAHSIGVLGETGHGIEEHFCVPPDTIDIKMGTFSKAIPSVGGYIAGSKRLCEFLSHEARGFIYSGALSPRQRPQRSLLWKLSTRNQNECSDFTRTPDISALDYGMQVFLCLIAEPRFFPSSAVTTGRRGSWRGTVRSEASTSRPSRIQSSRRVRHGFGWSSRPRTGLQIWISACRSYVMGP